MHLQSAGVLWVFRSFENFQVYVGVQVFIGSSVMWICRCVWACRCVAEESGLGGEQDAGDRWTMAV